MLLSRFNNTCWIDNVDEYCSINSCSMLTKNNNCYNVVGTRSDNNREQLWTMVVDNSCWKSAAQHCWQGAEQHCNKLLTTLIKLFIFACVVKSQNSATGPWSWRKPPQNNILFRNRFPYKIGWSRINDIRIIKGPLIADLETWLNSCWINLGFQE